jgi:hypothetical protein
MIKVHKLENGDVIKILPILSHDNKVSWSVETQLTVIQSGNNNVTIYDNSDKNYLKRISNTQRFKLSVTKPIPVTTRHYFNIYIDGEVRIMNVTKTLFEKIVLNANLLQLKDNYHLHIIKEDVRGGYFDFSKSFVEQVDWTPPVNDIESKEEWVSFIKSQTFDDGATDGQIRLGSSSGNTINGTFGGFNATNGIYVEFKIHNSAIRIDTVTVTFN